jgi:hypothetical protein
VLVGAQSKLGGASPVEKGTSARPPKATERHTLLWYLFSFTHVLQLVLMVWSDVYTIWLINSKLLSWRIFRACLITDRITWADIIRYHSVLAN